MNVWSTSKNEEESNGEWFSEPVPVQDLGANLYFSARSLPLRSALPLEWAEQAVRDEQARRQAGALRAVRAVRGEGEGVR